MEMITVSLVSPDNGILGKFQSDDEDVIELIAGKILGQAYGITTVATLGLHTEAGVFIREVKACHEAPCPACKEPVPLDEEDGPVWACPADLGKDNPAREPAPEFITEEAQKAVGVYSNCATDFGQECPYEHLPLHSACYEGGNF